MASPAGQHPNGGLQQRMLHQLDVKYNRTQMLVKHVSLFLSLQVVLSHTPYRQLAKDLGDKPVVISGRGASEVAAAYGFKRAVTTSQLSARYPTAVPFCHDPGVAPSRSCL